MKIILRQDYENLGKAGDIVKVKPGFARNFLLPNKIAFPAQPNYVKMLEEEKRQKQYKVGKLKQAAENLAAKLSGVTITIPVLVGEDGKLFGSVTTIQVADALKEKGFDIERRRISLPDEVKTTGVYEVKVNLHREVEAAFTMEVVSE